MGVRVNLGFWQNAYKKANIRDGYLLRMAVKGSPFGMAFIFPMWAVYNGY